MRGQDDQRRDPRPFVGSAVTAVDAPSGRSRKGRDDRLGARELYRAVLLAAGLVVLGLLFRQLVTLVVAVLITVIIAIPLAALASRLERRGIPRAIGAMVGLVVGLAALAGVLALVIPPVVQQATEFADRAPAAVDDLRGRMHDATGSGSGSDGAGLAGTLRRYVDEPQRLIGPLSTLGLSLVGGLGALLLMVMTALYMAIRPDPLVEGALRIFPPNRRERALRVMQRLRGAWIGWMRGVLVDMALTAVLLYLALTLVGLEFAALFAALSALLVVVPYFGAIAGAIPPVLFGLAHSPEKALLVAAVYLLVQQIESNVIIPLVMSRTAKLHPAVIAIGVVVVGQLFGFLGLFVAVPILSAVVILTEELWVRRAEEDDRRADAPVVEVPPSAGPVRAASA